MYGHKSQDDAQKDYEKRLRKYERNKDKLIQEYKECKQKKIDSFIEIPDVNVDGLPRIVLDDNPLNN